MPVQRKVWRQYKKNDIGGLRLEQEQLPDPADGEVTVELKAIGLNFADIFALLGLYSATPEVPYVPGLEFSGVITGKSRRDIPFTPGDRVMGVTRFGAYTTHLNIDFRYLKPVPEGWSFEVAAAFPVQALTAYYALYELGNLQKNHTVLIHSAAGGVGLMALAMAKITGARTIGTVGSPEKVELLKKRGCDRVIVRDKFFRKRLEEALHNRELNLALECIGGKIFKITWEALAPEGRLVTYGAASFMTQSDRPNWFRLLWQYLTRPRIDPLALPRVNKSIMGFNLIWLYDRVERMHQLMEAIEEMPLPEPLIGRQFSFEQLPAAIRYFQRGKSTGKVVVRI